MNRLPPHMSDPEYLAAARVLQSMKQDPLLQPYVVSRTRGMNTPDYYGSGLGQVHPFIEGEEDSFRLVVAFTPAEGSSRIIPVSTFDNFTEVVKRVADGTSPFYRGRTASTKALTIEDRIDSAIENLSGRRTGSIPYKGPGMILSRLGGWSPTKQTSDMAPESKGTWAFIWPFFEPFLVSSTDSYGPTDDESSNRFSLMKENKRNNPSLALKKIRYEGPIYTRLRVPGAKIIGAWALTNTRDLKKYTFGRFKVEEFGIAAQSHRDQYGHRPDYKPLRHMKRYSKDHYEVFIPANQGKFSRV